MNTLKATLTARRISRLIKPFLLVDLSFLLMITACQRSNISTLQKEVTSECRVIKHRRGEACVPLEPKRIVALDIPAVLDPLLALGIKPAGTVVDHFGDGKQWSGDRYFPALMPELVEGIEIVGVEPTPSLEAVLKLKPDLIILADQFEPAYEQLSQIAPSVLVDTWRDRAPIKENFMNIAEIVGKEKKAEEVLAHYEGRISEFRRQLSDYILNSEISVLDYYENQLYVSANWASYYQVFQDLELEIKPLLLEQEEFASISIETIKNYDADIIFFIGSDGPSEVLSQNPLIQSLEAVKRNHVYFVSSKAWDFYGPIGMNLFLDDLSKYLLEGKQDPNFSKND